MPIYEYRCAACGFQKEYLRKVSDANLSVCPECGKDTFRKLPTAAGFQLKGSGWYATDFKHRGAKPAAAKADADSRKDAATKKEQGADAKPDGEAKSAAKPAEAAPAAVGSGGTSTS
jgi:putative FmdB family regulatory protein